MYEGLIGQLPFRYVDRNVFTPQGIRRVRINAESEPDPGPAPVKFVSFEDYLLWRDVGLRGRLPDGRPDPSWRGRHDERNALFADVLIYTGMRLGEASCLLAPELPGERAAARGLGAIDLGPAVTKRSRARTVFAPPRLVRALDRYARIERGEMVARISAAESTVYTYLDVLDEAQEIVASALARWDCEAGALAAVFAGDQNLAAEAEA